MTENLLVETGRVVSIEQDCLWIETIQKSACQSCSARSGCGQHVLSSLVERSSYLRVLLNGRNPDDFHRGSIVKIGVPADVIAKGALIVYLLPLVGMLLGAVLGQVWLAHDNFAVLLGLLGFIGGGGVVYWHHLKVKSDPRYQPVLVDDVERDCIQVS